MPSKKGKKASTNLERFRVICRIPSLQNEWYPSSTFADAINKYYQLSGDEIITVKDLDDAIARDIYRLEGNFSPRTKKRTVRPYFLVKNQCEAERIKKYLRANIHKFRIEALA